MLYRPLFPGTAPEEKARPAASHEVDLDRESTWISYRPISLEAFQPSLLDQFSHHRLATDFDTLIWPPNDHLNWPP